MGSISFSTTFKLFNLYPLLFLIQDFYWLIDLDAFYCQGKLLSAICAKEIGDKCHKLKEIDALFKHFYSGLRLIQL